MPNPYKEEEDRVILGVTEKKIEAFPEVVRSNVLLRAEEEKRKPTPVIKPSLERVYN